MLTAYAAQTFKRAGIVPTIVEGNELIDAAIELGHGIHIQVCSEAIYGVDSFAVVQSVFEAGKLTGVVWLAEGLRSIDDAAARGAYHVRMARKSA